ncbi:ATP/GTP-binding protein [Rhizobium brockwellii]|uniref:AAA family ATPase n=1 Tax=Rhizobium brockwellii TaxID=3019932 RepID=UPI003F9B375D
MLLRFSAENHLSLRGKMEVSLVAAKLKDFDEGLIQTPINGISVLPAAIIYGPNASGKSNIIGALSFMRALVVSSQISGRPDSNIVRMPFALDAACIVAPTTLEADFLVNDVRFNYGFSYVDQQIEKEWLITYPNGRAQNLFIREGQQFAFGRKLRGRNAVIADLTRKNSLFLSAAAQSDHDELTPIYKFFSEMVIIQAIAMPGHIASSEFEHGTVDERVINFLNNMGTGVVGYRRTEQDASEFSRELTRNLTSLMQKFATSSEPAPDLSKFDREKDVAIELGHSTSDGAVVYFNMDRESAGTRRMLVMLSRIFEVLDRGGLIIIDELDASLHTQASELIFSLFSSSDYNADGAQMIATVHDTNLLSSEYIRRDQVWLCEKKPAGDTEVFPLTDIRLRHTDDFERGYLEGRFGALPVSGSIRSQIVSRKITSK